MEGVAETSKLTDRSTEAQKIIERVFIPVLEKDEAGFLRKIYSYGESKFMFRGREELPFLDGFKNFNVAALGSIPVNVSMDEYESYWRRFKKNDGDSLLLATMDMQGVVGIAKSFSIEEVTSTELMDKVIACKLKISKEGSDGEAIALASIFGDKEAIQFVENAVEDMENNDRAVLQAKREDLREQWEYHRRFEKVNVKDLVVVHATRYLPQQSEIINGFEVLPTGESTSWKYLRNTVHTTLNHKVEGHYGGHWDDTKYVIISPFTEVQSMNGNPSGLDVQDTWWVLGPGQKLKFPKARLVTPGDVLDGELIEFGKNHTYFKFENYTIRDVFRIDGGHPILWKHIRNVLHDYLSESTDFWKKIKTKYFPDMSIDYIKGYSDIDPKDIQKQFLHGDINEPIQRRIGQILIELGINDLGIELEQIEDKITEDIAKRLFGELNEMAVNQTIKRMGFPLRGDLKGGTGSLGQEFDSFITTTSHNYSIYNFLEQGHASNVQSATNNVDGRFDWKKYNSEQKILKSKGLDPKTRRVLYVSGMFNSRFEE